MVYKVFEEEGDFIRLSDNKRVNILFAEEAHTPQGLNVGWTHFEHIVTLSIEDSIQGFLYDPLQKQ